MSERTSPAPLSPFALVLLLVVTVVITAGLSAVWAGVAAITGGTFYSPQTATFPASYIGDYFFGEFVNSWIKRYDAGSNSVSNFASNAGNPVDLKVGPDGALYYLARGAGRVFRVQSTQSGPCIADVVPSGSVNVSTAIRAARRAGARSATER